MQATTSQRCSSRKKLKAMLEAGEMDVDLPPTEELSTAKESSSETAPLLERSRTPVQETHPDERLKNWTKEEINELRLSIKAFGSDKISQIAPNIPLKSEEEIKMAIAYYRERALQQQIHPKQKRKIWSTQKNTLHPPVPLNAWAKFLQDSLKFKDLYTETPTALRMIAELDNIPPATQTDNIDFREVYHSIANAMEGKPITDNVQVSAILNKCLLETALTSRAFMRMGALQNIIEYIDMSDKAISVLPRPTENAELATLRHLASQRNYNPLNISEQYLMPN